MTTRNNEDQLIRPVLSRREVGQELGVSPATIDRLLRSGALPKLKVGGRTLVRRSDLERFIDSGGTMAARSPHPCPGRNEHRLDTEPAAS